MHAGIDVAKYQKLMDDENNWAKSHSERRKGLSKITIDKAPEALYFPKCRSIHTFKMKFDIQVLFFDRKRNLLAMKRAKPNRIVRSPKGTRSILEIPCK